MPKEILEKLSWLFLLLPGFVCVSIAGSIADLGALSEFQITYFSLILTLPIVLLALPVGALVEGLMFAKFWPGTQSTQRSSYAFFVSSLAVACVLGVALGITIERDYVFRSLRSLPGTDVLNKRSTKRPLSFLLSQNSGGQLKVEGDARPKEMKRTEAFIRVRLKDGLEYEGWPEFYETGNAPTELYLSPACRVDSGGAVTVLPGPGVVVVEAEIRAVEFLDREASQCWMLYYKPSRPASAAGRGSK
jgi:hypothetical protein